MDELWQGTVPLAATAVVKRIEGFSGEPYDDNGERPGGTWTIGYGTIIDAQGTDKEFTRADLGAALGSFVTSTDNKSGVGLSDLTSIVAAISTDNSVMYGGGLTQSTGPGPTITLGSPAKDSTAKDQALIIGQAESTLGVAGVVISLDGTAVGSGGVRQSTTSIVWSFAQPVADGFHTLVVSAEDASGVTSSLTVTFSSDKTPPQISLASCIAFDDSARVGVFPHFDTGLVDWGAPIRVEGCDASSLATGQNPPFTFVTYADLADAAATSSVINILPQDSGLVFTPPEQLLVVASIYRGGLQIGDTTTLQAAADNGAVRAAPISTELFGPALGTVSQGDVLELRVSATDTEGNTGTSSYFFSLDLLPAPLGLKPETPPTTSPNRIESYSFDAGNADAVFIASPQYGVFVESQQELKNLSAHAAMLGVAVSSASVSATVTEWTGLVAAQATTFEIPNNSDFQIAISAESPSEAGLATPTLSDFWDTCINNGSDYPVSQASVPANPNILTIANGQSVCQPANNFLAANTLAGTSNWIVVVLDSATGLPLVANAVGEFSVAPQAVVRVVIGITVPQFGSQAYPACAPLYTDDTYISSALLKASSFADQTVYFSNGIIPSRTVYANDPKEPQYASLTWNGRGAIDCTGFSCGHSGCRSDAAQTLLRVQGATRTMDFHEGDGNWLRQVDRHVAELALSNMHATSSFAVTGSASLTAYARTQGNSRQWPLAVGIPPLSPIAVHARNSNQPPDTGIRYTKGLLP